MELKELRKYASENSVPVIREKSSLLLADLVKKHKAKNILEIGTAIGYSGSIMLECGEDIKLTTIEKNTQSASIARKTFIEKGFEKRTCLIEGDAKEVIAKLAKEKKQYDFIFLDGPKGQYIKYLPVLKGLLTNGGVLVADNIFLHGMVLSEEKICHKHRTMVNNLRKFIEAISHDVELETKLYDIEDGMSESIKNKK